MTTQQSTPFTTATGRLLWGSLYTPKTEDFDGNPLTIKSGPDAGKPTQYFEFGVAFEKVPGHTHFSQFPLGLLAWQAGHAAHPASAQRSDFSWKIKDGDSAVPGRPFKGKPGRAPKDIEGYPGHWVFTFRSSYAPKVVNADGSAYILDKEAVVPGDWVQVSGTISGNSGASPGIYINHNFVALQYKGVPIQTGADPKTLGFGGGQRPAGYVAPTGQMAAPPVAGAQAQAGQPAAPVGAAAVPAVPVNAAPVGAVAVAQGAAPAGYQTASIAQTSPSSPVAVAPHPGILHPPAGAPVVPAAPAPAYVPPAPPAIVVKLSGVTWEQLLANNWTEATARAAGHIV